MHTVIAFATGWGSKYGGINSFNTDFLSAFGVAYHSNVQVVCIVPEATVEQVEDARITHVRLVPLPFSPQDKTLSESHAFAAIAELARLGVSFIQEETFWLGHDRITGAAANAAAKAAGGRSALIHHMSYDHYESFAENSAAAYEKAQMQKALFRNADVVLAVGPLLRDALSDLLSESKPVYMLIPGLAEIETRGAPKTFSVFMSGRLSDDAARIKQGHLGIAAFSQAHLDARNLGMPEGLCSRPKLVLRGVDFESSLSGELNPQADPEAELKAFAEEYAKCVINLHALPYTQDRKTLYEDLRSASVAMMPSWHEGFGLVAWEAIAAGVPLILSTDSGVYRLIKETHPGAEKGFTYPIHIDGSTSFPFFQSDDLQKLVSKIMEIAINPGEARTSAGTLREMLCDYTWTACAEQAVQAFGWTLQKGSIPLTLVTPAAPLPKTPIQQSAPAPTSASPLQMPIKHWRRGQGIADSQLLRAEEELVPFDPARQPELDTLNIWLDDPQFPQAVRLITGAGGVGKTRLALELCRQSIEKGWHAGFLGADLEANQMASAWKILRALNQNLLIIVDYAETRQAVLLALIKEILKEKGTQPVRILLLARNGGEWWDNLPSRDSACEPILCGYATTGPYDLLPLHPTAQNRHDAYRQALQSFAEALGVSVPDVIPTLEGEHFERPLYVQMAALLALHGERPTTAEGLTRALLNHERRYWRGLLTSFGGVEPERYAQQLLAISTLAGGFATSRAAQSLVKAASLSPLPDGQFNALFNALAPLYPGKQGLQAVRPDLLGEALIAQTLLSPEAPHLLDAILSNKASATIRRHALTVLTRLAMQRDDLHETLIEALVRNFSHCYKEITEVAIETNGPLPSLAEAAFTRLIPAQKSQIVGVLEPLLREESVRLAGFSCMVTGYLAEKCCQKLERRPGTVDLMQDYASALMNYSICLHRVGRDVESLSDSYRSLEYFKKLNCIDKTKTRFSPGYALSMNNYATQLAAAGRYEEALEHVREALGIFQRLAEKNPDSYEFDYAGLLNNYAIRLAEWGRYEEALQHAWQALEIHQRLAQKNPDCELDYARSLNTYANRLAEGGRDEDALNHARQAFEIYQRLAQKNPDRHECNYAATINNYVNRLSEAGRNEEALEHAWQALEIHQRLVQKNPDRYEFDYAGSLNNYASELAAAGRSEDALEHARQSMEICQRLAEKSPDRYESDCASFLNNYANWLAEAGRYEEAHEYARRSSEIYKRLAIKNPTRFEEEVFNEEYFVIFLGWLSDVTAVDIKTLTPCDLPENNPLHRQLLLRLYSTFIQACRASKGAARSASFAQVLPIWSDLSMANKIQAQPYWLSAVAWCATHAPELVSELDWQSELNKYARQRQGNLPQWMLTVADRLDFSFDLSQFVAEGSQQVRFDDSGLPCPSA